MTRATYERRTVLPVSAEAAFAWHGRDGAFERLAPPWQDVRIVERKGTIRDGDRTTIELRSGPFRRRWVAVHEGFHEGVVFGDRQERGPFHDWHHEHRFHGRDDGGSELEDAIVFQLPLGPAGRAVAGRYVDAQLDRVFAFRHRRLSHDLERHAMTNRALRIAITGSSGLIGTALSSFLATGGHEVVRIVRGAPSPDAGREAPSEVRVSDLAEVRVSDLAALEGIDAVIHLAGEPIGRRWTEARKREILRSRDEGTRALATAIASLARPPEVLVSISAVGIYGSRGEEVLTEESVHGDDFLASVCEAWEAATLPAAEAGVRVVNLRLGVVLEALLPRLLLPFRLGLGGRVGDGRHWLSWLSLDDATAAIHQAVLDVQLRGPVNATSPHPVTNRELTKTLGRVLRRPTLLPFPAVGVSALFGEMGRATVLASQRVLPERLVASGFRFAYPELETALRHTLGR
jgi:uncharacterized protein